MNLVTVYKAFRKQAAAGMPEQLSGGQFDVNQLPGMKPIQPITAPGAVPLDQQQDPMAAAGAQPAAPKTPQQAADGKSVEKMVSEGLDTMVKMKAMETGMDPQAVASSAGAGVPGMGGKMDNPAGPGMVAMSSVDYGTVYKSLMKRASWLGRQVNNVFGADTWMGRTFGESPETAAENFYNSQISPETQAQRKTDAAAYDKSLAAQSQRINGNINTAVAAAQQQSQEAKNQQLAKQRAADKYIQQLAAQQGVQLSGAQRNQISQNAGIRQPQQNVARMTASKPRQSVATAQKPGAQPMTTMQAQKARAAQQQQLRQNDAAIRRRDVAAFNRGGNIRRPSRG